MTFEEYMVMAAGLVIIYGITPDDVEENMLFEVICHVVGWLGIVLASASVLLRMLA